MKQTKDPICVFGDYDYNMFRHPRDVLVAAGHHATTRTGRADVPQAGTAVPGRGDPAARVQRGTDLDS